MARQQQVEACFICGEIPCDCNKKAPAKRKAKATRTPSTVPVPVGKGGGAGNKDRFTELAKKDARKEARPSLVADEVTATAIRYLAPLLHPEERRRYADIINPRNMEAANKLAEWRAKHVSDNN